jgi:biopolymer transport protein ExbB
VYKESLMRRVICPFLAVALVLLTAGPALAQDGGTTTSYFKMFFLSGDWLGLIIIWTLLAMSFVAIGLIVHFLIQYRRSTVIPDDTHEQLAEMLEQKRYREAIDFAQGENSYLSKLVNAALAEAPNGFGAMERSVEEASDNETTRMLRPIEYLNVMGNVSPMMGLFGTVYGMIVAFNKLVEAGGRPDPAELAAGISTALVTTFWGLVVAIPAMTAYALIRNKIDALAGEGLIMTEELIRPFRPGAKKTTRPRATPKPGESAPAQ